MDAPYFACGRPAGDAKRQHGGCVCEFKQGHENRSRRLREGGMEEATERGGAAEKARRLAHGRCVSQQWPAAKGPARRG